MIFMGHFLLSLRDLAMPQRVASDRALARIFNRLCTPARFAK